jgi:hypothetical protein
MPQKRNEELRIVQCERYSAGEGKKKNKCGFGMMITLELTFLRNCSNEVICRGSILRKFHFDIDCGTNDFDGVQVYIL